MVQNQLVNMLVSNVSSQRVNIPKGMVIALGAGDPHQSVLIDQMFDMKNVIHLEATMNLVHYKPRISHKSQMVNARDVARNNYQREEHE